MTKKDLMEALNQVDDDAEIRVMVCFDEGNCEYLYQIDYDDVVTGKDLHNEVTILGYL